MSIRLNKSFKEVVYNRRSCRSFLSTPVPQETIIEVLNDAQQSPSNCNTQPWETHIVSGDKLKELAEAIIKAKNEGNFTPDFSFDMDAFYGRYGERNQEQGKYYYESLGVARDDKEAREAASDKNLSFFNAPHVALLFMPSFGDNVRVAGDIGMYGQTFLLSLVDHNLAGVPQTYLGFFAETIRETLGITADKKMLFGISFGYPNLEELNRINKIGRDPLNESVIFHQ